MLGQISLFQPDKNGRLRNRVQIQIAKLSQVRYVLENYHYLHRTRVGRQINYIILFDGEVEGVITYAYPMISQPIAGVPSDEVIEFARLFLAHNIPHVASCAIGKTLHTVQSDWMKLFPDSKKPRLVVSWSDKEYHKGTIYRAANFVYDGISGGQLHGNSVNSKRGRRISQTDYQHKKDRWIYWLDKRKDML